MNVSLTELALFLGAVATVFGVISNARRIDELQKQLDAARRDLIEARRSAQSQNDIARTNIILLGESMGNVRNDNAKMALLINQLFNQFEEATGRKPDVNIDMLRHMRTIEYITGPLDTLGRLEVPER